MLKVENQKKKTSLLSSNSQQESSRVYCISPNVRLFDENNNLLSAVLVQSIDNVSWSADLILSSFYIFLI